MYVLSPYVWQNDAGYHVLLRGVNPAPDATKKISRIYYGRSTDGCTFVMEEQPVLAPGPDPYDADGCEDPTVVQDGQVLLVYYSGWNGARQEGQLLLATGVDVHGLQKEDVVLPYTERFQDPKEAALTRCPDGTWRLFFEYSRDGASRVGWASGPSARGPWTVGDDPFTARPGRWDGWHLSPGPVVRFQSDDTILIYNGATKEGVWRIGWVAFDETVSHVTGRCSEPIIVPPPPQQGYRDVAFASSAIVQDSYVWLYYSVADKDLYRATLADPSVA